MNVKIRSSKVFEKIKGQWVERPDLTAEEIVDINGNIIHREIKHVKDWNENNEQKSIERNSYKDRFITEYKELKSRLDKLHKIIIKYKAETLDFEPDCPIELLEDQEYYMSDYLKVLEIRAEIEKINLD